MELRIYKLIIPLEILLFITSIAGLFTNIYFRETPNWQAQAMGQDIINLFVLFPAILGSAAMLKRGSRAAIFVLLGSLLYTVYTFGVYCFAVHFNPMFIIYCAVFGLSIYSLIYFSATFNFNLLNEWFNIDISKKRNRADSFIIYFLIILAILFFLIWLGEIIPAALSGETPKSITEIGMPTNPVYVLDLSIFLPAIFISALLLKRKNRLGYLMAPSLLIFSLIMSVTLSALMIILNLKGLEGSLILSFIFLVVAAISMAIFRSFIIQMKKAV